MLAAAGAMIFPAGPAYCKKPAGYIIDIETIRIGIPGVSRIKEYSHLFETAARISDTDLSYPVLVEAAVESNRFDSGDFICRADFKNGLTIFTGSCYPEGITYEGPEGLKMLPRPIPAGKACRSTCDFMDVLHSAMI